MIIKKENQKEILRKLDIIYNPFIKTRTSKNASVMRIECDSKFTRIDFVYHTSSKYINGGWVQMNGTCYIKPINSEAKLPLIKAVNIPMAPNKHHFKTVKDVLYYTLYFPPLPSNTNAIDIIELDTNDPTYFNFYNVSIDRIVNKVIDVSN